MENSTRSAHRPPSSIRERLQSFENAKEGTVMPLYIPHELCSGIRFVWQRKVSEFGLQKVGSKRSQLIPSSKGTGKFLKIRGKS